MRHLHLEHCTVDLAARLVHRGAERVPLTEVEARLLACFARQPGRPVPREELLAEVWGLDGAVVTRCVDTAVRRVRTKIERVPDEPRHLLKVHGVGYRFDPRGPPPVEAPALGGALPVPADRFVGREAELAWLARALHGEHGRVEVVGAPGSGRRRLVLEAARRYGGAFPGGVHVGRLAPDRPAGRALLVLPEGGEAVEIGPPLPPRGRGAGGEGPAAIPLGTVILAVARRASVARVLRLGPMSPGDATALLLDRAGTVDAVGPLVDALGGHPLAVEEAAARLALLSPAELVARLDDPAVLPRTTTRIRDTLTGLAPDLSLALARCAAFEGPFPVAAAEAVVGEGALERLQELVDRGLLLREPTATPARLRVLPRLRPVALAGGDGTERARHLAWLLTHGEAQHTRYRGPEQDAARAAVTALLPDYERALAFAAATAPVAAVRLLLVLDAPLGHAADFARASRLHDTAAARLPDLPPLWRTRLLQMRCEALRMQGRLAEARADALAARGEAAASGDATELGHATAMVALMDHTEGDLDAAERGYAEAADRLGAAGAPHYQAVWTSNLGGLLVERGRHAEAEPLLRRVLDLRRAQRDPVYEARARSELGALLLDRGALAEAEAHLTAGLALWEAQRDERYSVFDRTQLALLYAETGRPERALPELARVEAMAERTGEHRTLAEVARQRAVCELLRGEVERAQGLLRLSIERMARSEQPELAALAHAWLFGVEACRGRLRDAATARDEARRHAGSDLLAPVAPLLALGEVHLDLARARAVRTTGAARQRGHEALRVLERAGPHPVEVRLGIAWLQERLAG